MSLKTPFLRSVRPAGQSASHTYRNIRIKAGGMSLVIRLSVHPWPYAYRLVLSDGKESNDHGLWHEPCLLLCLHGLYRALSESIQAICIAPPDLKESTALWNGFMGLAGGNL